MPIAKNWSKANSEHIKQNVPEKKGIYELRAYGNLVYIGMASDLRRRLLEHLSRNPNYYRFEKAGWLTDPKTLEDRHLTRYERKHGSLPTWNKNDTRAKR